MSVVGIDVSKATLDVAVFDGAKFKTKRFANHGKGIAALQAWLAERGAQGGAVGLEATGGYQEAAACALHDAGFAVSVLNPAQVHAFIAAELGRGKTDALDARRIARFMAVHRPPVWTPAPLAVRTLQALVRRLDAVLDLIGQEGNRLDTAHASVRDSIQTILTALEHERSALEARIAQHIDDDPDLRQRRDWLNSIPGISARTSAVVLSHLQALERCKDVRQWVAYAGLDPAIAQSGTSLQRPGHLSKRGSPALRKALYMPALVAIRHNPTIAAFAQRLRQAGKPGKVVVCAAMRKLMHIIFGVLKHRTDFQPLVAG